jgi:hypothetical protein
MKFANEFRGGFGTGIRINKISKQREALPLPYFEYTGCLLQYVDKCDEAYEAQRQAVKKLVSKYHPVWCVKEKRPLNVIYGTDPVTILKGIGTKTGPMLNQLGFTTVGDIKRNVELMSLLTTTPGQAVLGAVKLWLEKQKNEQVFFIFIFIFLL